MDEWHLLLSRDSDTTWVYKNTQKEKGKAAPEVGDIQENWKCEDSQPMLMFTTCLCLLPFTVCVTDEYPLLPFGPRVIKVIA